MYSFIDPHIHYIELRLKNARTCKQCKANQKKGSASCDTELYAQILLRNVCTTLAMQKKQLLCAAPVKQLLLHRITENEIQQLQQKVDKHHYPY